MTDVSKEITWEELQNFGIPPKKVEPKKVIKIPVSTWSWHNCDKSHKTSTTLLKCSLDKYYFNGSNAHKPSIRIRGYGNWAVLKESWSETYYTTHNGRSNNQTHKIFEVALHETYEDAVEAHQKLSHACWDDDCSGRSCRYLRGVIIKVVI